MDVHEDIHRVIESYLDANEFRRNLNSAIQNARGVTFLLQKRKSRWPDFDTWYGAWQEEAKANPILGWSVGARNRIVKEEDLLTLSQARVSFYGERLREMEHVLQVPADMSVDEMVAMYAELAQEVPSTRAAWIRVQRRWVDDQLPDSELVAALREVFRGIAKVVALAHHASEVDGGCSAPPFARACVSPEIDGGLQCLGREDPLPSGILDARTGDRLRTEYGSMQYDSEVLERGFEKYGKPPRFSEDPVEHARQRLLLSRRFLEADGYSGPTLMLLRGREARLGAVPFPEGQPRELMIALAVDAVGAWPFDGAVFSSEMWLNLPGSRGSTLEVDKDALLPTRDEFFDADKANDREEALVVIGIASDGRGISLALPFGRTNDGIVYGGLIEDVSHAMVPAFLRPVLLRWPKNNWSTFWAEDHER